MTKYVVLWLESPLQSWGSDSLFDRRSTLNFPTMSGVLGIVCSAMGLSGPQKEFLEPFSGMKMYANSYMKSVDNKSAFNPKVLRDFHMTGAGYTVGGKSWESFRYIRNADGIKKDSITNLSLRYYLQDSYFSVVLEIPDEYSADIQAGLTNPVWDICLGRKACIPTDMVFRGIHATLTEAEKECHAIAESKGLETRMHVCDFDNIQDFSDVLNITDVPVEFGEFKKYRTRKIGILLT